MGSLSRLIHNSKTCFSPLFTNRCRWQKWSSLPSHWLRCLWLHSGFSLRKICLPLTSQTTIRNKEICSHYNWVNRAPAEYFALSKHFRQFSLFRHILMKSFQVALLITPEPCCQHLWLIIKIFQAVPSSHKNWNACAPDPAVSTQRQMTKNCFSVTKLIRLLTVFYWKKQVKIQWGKW